MEGENYNITKIQNEILEQIFRDYESKNLILRCKEQELNSSESFKKFFKSKIESNNIFYKSKKFFEDIQSMKNTPIHNVVKKDINFKFNSDSEIIDNKTQFKFEVNLNPDNNITTIKDLFPEEKLSEFQPVLIIRFYSNNPIKSKSKLDFLITALNIYFNSEFKGREQDIPKFESSVEKDAVLLKIRICDPNVIFNLFHFHVLNRYSVEKKFVKFDLDFKTSSDFTS